MLRCDRSRSLGRRVILLSFRLLSAALLSGTLLIASGSNSTTNSATEKAACPGAEQLKPAAIPSLDCTTTGTWTTRRSMNLPAAFAGTVALADGRIFVISGFCPYGKPRQLTNAVRVFHPDRDTWTETSPIPTPRASPGAAVGPDGKIYVVGGIDRDAKYNVVEAYNPERDTWVRLKPMPTKRDDGLCAVAAKGADGRVRIYAIGGRDDSKPGNGLNTVEAYDPPIETWTSMTPMPTHRHALAATLGPDGRIYAIGGTNDRVFATDAVESYDSAKDSWTRGTPTPYGQQCAAATSTPGPDGEDLVLAGWGSRHEPLYARSRLQPPYPEMAILATAAICDGRGWCGHTQRCGRLYPRLRPWRHPRRDHGAKLHRAGRFGAEILVPNRRSRQIDHGTTERKRPPDQRRVFVLVGHLLHGFFPGSENLNARSRRCGGWGASSPRGPLGRARRDDPKRKG